MKTNFYKTILFILLSIGMLFMYYRVSNLEHKYETLKEANVRLKTNNPLNEAQIKERQFKEEMYIRQQESDTTLILFVFSLGSVVIGIFTFRTVKEEFVSQINQVKKEYNDYKNDIEKKHIEISHNFSRIIRSLNFESALSIMREAKSINDKSTSTGLMLTSIEKLIHVLESNIEENQTLRNSIIDMIESQVEIIFLYLTDEQAPIDELILDYDKEIFYMRHKIIMNYLNSNAKDELYRKFLLSMSKIKLKDA